MGRKSHSKSLDVWANGLRVGCWTIPANGPSEFRYDETWLELPEGRPLSLSLPINLDGAPIKGNRVDFYFDNLLPDSEVIRHRIQSRFHTHTGSPFDLLQAVGRDCIGALQLLPEGQPPVNVFSIEAEPLDELGVERHLMSATSARSGSLGALNDDDDFRISIAGAQEKSALTWHEERWCLPKNATPTTHIFKLPLGAVGERQMDLSQSVENEWLCSKILAGYSIPVASCEIKHFASTKTLVVERFDRKLHPSGKHWLRLPQEDFCQATGTPSGLKYEADGGPGIVEIAKLLHGSETPDEDLSTFLRAQLLFWMLAATDGHAKNFSIRILPQGRFRLTPLYDVLSAWPIAGSRANQLHPKKLKLAMALRGTHKHYRVEEVQRRHFHETAVLCGFGSGMATVIDEVIEKTPEVIESVGQQLPPKFPERLFDSVTRGLRKAAQTLHTMAGT